MFTAPGSLKRKKDGRGRLFVLKHQHPGNDKWDADIKRMMTLLHNCKWKGNSSHTLDLFILQHRAAYIFMQTCSLYVDYQKPNEDMRVGYLFNGIEYNNTAM